MTYCLPFQIPNVCTNAKYNQDSWDFTNSPGVHCPSYPAPVLGVPTRTMQSCLWSLMLLFSVSFGSLVNGAAVLSNPSILQLINSTTQIDIPTDFRVILEETPIGPPVGAAFCLDLAIRIVGDYLALEEFTETIQAQGWSNSKVVISISTKWIPGYKIERRFVIWGIYEALKQFEDQNNFRSAIFTLSWRGNPVGNLAIYPEGLSGTNTSFNSPAPTKLEPSPLTIRGGSNQSVSLNLRNPEDRELKLRVELLEPRLPLDLHSTLLTVLAALCDAAQWPKNKVVPGRYTVRAEPSRTQIIIGPAKILNYRWLIKALTMIPQELPSWITLYSCWVEIRLGNLYLGLMNILPTGRMLQAPNALIETSVNVSIGSASARRR